MATPEDVAQIGDFNSGVNLSGGKILMSQQSLDMPETGSVLEKMGCACMPHHMRGDSKLEIGSLSIAVKALAHGMATHPFAQHRDEESRLSAIGQVRANGVEVSFGGLPGLRCDGNKAVLVSFSRANVDQLLVQA